MPFPCRTQLPRTQCNCTFPFICSSFIHSLPSSGKTSIETFTFGPNHQNPPFICPSFIHSFTPLLYRDRVKLLNPKPFTSINQSSMLIFWTRSVQTEVWGKETSAAVWASSGGVSQQKLGEEEGRWAETGPLKLRDWRWRNTHTSKYFGSVIVEHFVNTDGHLSASKLDEAEKEDVNVIR